MSKTQKPYGEMRWPIYSQKQVLKRGMGLLFEASPIFHTLQVIGKPKNHVMPQQLRGGSRSFGMIGIPGLQ